MYILVVEDDSAIRETLKEVLSMEGYLVRTACHGREALEILARGPKPALMLVDLMMPVVDGWQLIELLSEDHEMSKVPVVVLSAVVSGEHFQGRKNSLEILKKPFEINKLLEVVRKHAGRDLKSGSSIGG